MTSEERREARYQRRKAKRDEARLRRSKECGDFDEVFSFRHLYLSGKKCCKGVYWKTQLSGISAISFRSSQRPIVNCKTEPSSTVVFTLSPSWSEGRSGISDQSISRNERFKSVCVTTAWFLPIRPVSSMTTQPV